ncbi:MAG: SMP-30/gluconolactonase/LRE family protein [Betaproteobacteria bacterium]
MKEAGVSEAALDRPEAGQVQARWLRPVDDVATVLVDLAAGAIVRLTAGAQTRDIVLLEPIRAGHKFAVRALASGLRVRKYGEFIGRTTCAVAAGAWVHLHNLATSARHQGKHERAWYETAEMANIVATLGSARCTVGESPVFDERNNRLYWIDVRETPAIHKADLGSGHEQSWPMQEDIGSIARSLRDQLLVALRSGFAFFDCATARMTPIVDPESALPHNRLNDGKCDPQGRFWCGSMNPESGTADGSLYVLDADLRWRQVLDDFLTPNGMTWSADGATMYLSDTRRGFIESFAFDGALGTLSERRVFADLGAMPGGPDGATMDAEGFLWSAQFEGGCLVRYAPDGSMDRVVRLPVIKPASCAFGGPDYRQLFVTTATRGMSSDDLLQQPLAGRVLVLDVGVAGLPPVRFAHRESVAENA